MYSSNSRRLDNYYARTDGFGRLFFDKCATDEEHLLNTEIPEGQDRPRCRVYAQDLLPQGSLGQKGNWIARFMYDDCDPFPLAPDDEPSELGGEA
jgi:hypothetical protein